MLGKVCFRYKAGYHSIRMECLWVITGSVTSRAHKQCVIFKPNFSLNSVGAEMFPKASLVWIGQRPFPFCVVFSKADHSLSSYHFVTF